VSDIANIVAELGRLDREREILMDKLRAATGAGPSALGIVTISVGEAAFESGYSESQVRRDCAANPYDKGGFGMRKGGQWRVAADRFRASRCANARFRRE
jgi:hypothetical protein